MTKPLSSTRNFVGALRRPLERADGSAMLLVSVLMAIVAFGLVSHQVLSYSYQGTLRQANFSVQADNAAKAGIIDTLSWFRNQPTQPLAGGGTPDAIFAPQQSKGDTIDQSIGLVKEMPISAKANLWARYEVPYAALTGNGQWTGVHDITDLRTLSPHAAGEGLVWSVQSNGCVYHLASSSVPYNQAPNQVLATSKMRTEFRRLSLVLPADAAVTVNSKNGVSITNNAQLNGGSFPGLVYYSGTGSITGGSKISQSATRLSGGSGGMSLESIFAAQLNELEAMADLLLNSSDALPSAYPRNEIVVVNGNATFNAAHPLSGSGLLIVNGDLTIDAGANALFDGLIYVTGDVSITGPAQISGSLVVGGNLSVDGGGDIATIQYDTTVLSALRQQIGQYRISQNEQYVFSDGNSR